MRPTAVSAYAFATASLSLSSQTTCVQLLFSSALPWFSRTSLTPLSLLLLGASLGPPGPSGPRASGPLSPPLSPSLPLASTPRRAD